MTPSSFAKATADKEKTAFIKAVRDYYKKYGRHDLPWRKTSDPYKIAVSEVMLQQTQVNRVVEKYKAFLKAFPTAHSLANAPLRDVLALWSGLGYNRRARFLQNMAKAVVEGNGSKFPKTMEELVKLPGIGHYTAGAVMAFAYNSPSAFIETNIRTVYLHHFFNDSKENISDNDLLPLIEATIDKKNPREWYWALMDYGSYLKSIGIKIHRASAGYKKQKAFKGSLREVRGGIMKIVTKNPATFPQLQKNLAFENERLEKALQALIKEQLITKKGLRYSIA